MHAALLPAMPACRNQRASLSVRAIDLCNATGGVDQDPQGDQQADPAQPQEAPCQWLHPSHQPPLTSATTVRPLSRATRSWLLLPRPCWLPAAGVLLPRVRGAAAPRPQLLLLGRQALLLAGGGTPGRRGRGAGSAGLQAGADSWGEEEEVEEGGCDDSGDELTARARDVLRRADKAANRGASRGSRQQPRGRGRALGAALAAVAAGSSGAGAGGSDNDDEDHAGGNKEAELVELLTGAAGGRLGRGMKGQVSLTAICVWGGVKVADR